MNIDEALKKINVNDLTTIQISVLAQVVAALIRTHQNPRAVYERFDLSYSTYQVGMVDSASEAGSVIARHMVESLFDLPSTQETKP
jgi:hypothetical protein